MQRKAAGRRFFTAELTSGSVSSTDLEAITKGHETAIETAFVADEDKTDLSKWLYNGTPKSFLAKSGWYPGIVMR
jgi:hypothetical protein